MTQIIVVGASRSGTSMTAGILHRLGVFMGTKVLGATKDNLLGHFEDIEMSRVNRRMLKAALGSWSNPPVPWLLEQVATDEQMAPLIEWRNERHDVWGFKDPRTSLTLAKWLLELENPRIIWCRRDGDAVTRSLVKRNQLDYATAYDLWLIYNKRIADVCVDRDDVLEVQYEDVLDEPRAWVARIASFAGVEVTESAIGMVRGDLNHQGGGANEALAIDE